MLNDNINTCRNCVFRWKNFDVLTDDELDMVNRTRYEANFKAGEVIFKQGAPAANAVFISHGLGKIYIEGIDDKNLILAIVKPGWLVAGPGSYVDNRHHYTFSALTDAHACFVEMNTIKQLVKKNPLFAEGYLVDISKKSLGNFNKIVSMTQRKMHGRMAEVILYLGEEIYNADRFDCILNRQELGELAGLTKETVVRLLKEFSDDGILNVQNSFIEIIDKARLKKILSTG